MNILKNKVLQFEKKVKKYLNNKIGKINVKHKSQLDLVPFQVLTSAYSQNQLVATPPAFVLCAVCCVVVK